jgi:hypothetical protein
MPVKQDNFLLLYPALSFFLSLSFILSFFLSLFHSFFLVYLMTFPRLPSSDDLNDEFWMVWQSLFYFLGPEDNRPRDRVSNQVHPEHEAEETHLTLILTGSRYSQAQ